MILKGNDINYQKDIYYVEKNSDSLYFYKA